MIAERNKDWVLLKEVYSGYAFEQEFPEFENEAREVFKQELDETPFKEYQQERDNQGFDIFEYLLDKKGYSDDEYIESVLTAVKGRTFSVHYNEQTEHFEIYEQIIDNAQRERDIIKIEQFIQDNRNDRDLAESIYTFVRGMD